MGCIAGFGRIILIILNLVFVLVSLALIGVGVLFRFFPEHIMTAFNILDKVWEQSKGNVNLLKDLNLPGEEELKNIKDFPFLKEGGIALLVFGCVLFAISFSACCGACCKSKLLLMVFVVLMSILVVVQATVGGLFLAKSSPLHDKIKGLVSEQMRDRYDPTNNQDLFSISINLMNYMLECCGVTGLDDFTNKLPVASCCKREIAKDTTKRQDCLKQPSFPFDNFNTEGCYGKLQDKAVSNVVLAADILALILLLQIILIVFAYLNAKGSNAVGPV